LRAVALSASTTSGVRGTLIMTSIHFPGCRPTA
jgi:hypothetical protein